MATLAHHSFLGSGISSRLNRQFSSRAIAIIVLSSIFITALIDAMIAKRAPFDRWLLEKIQAIDLHGTHPVFEGIEHLTGSEGAVAMWVLSLSLFTIVRLWGAVVAIVLLPAGGLINEAVGTLLVARERPHLDSLTRTSSNWQEHSFPSGHVMGALLLYGLFFVIARKIPVRPARFAVQTASIVILASASFERLWDGAHWPSDVIGAYSLGGLILIGLIEIYHRVDRATAGMPFFRARREPHNWSQPHAHALTSLVRFDGDAVVKRYSPGFLPSALYWLAFQAPFPYVRNQAALRAAMHRRNLASMLAEYWRDAPSIARVRSISTAGQHPAIVSERINGETPRDRAAAKRALTALKQHFEEAGLPTWQIDPIQPRAIDNLLQTPDGKLHVVDLESGLVMPVASLKSWRRAIRRGLVPFFDDVYFDITRAYIRREALPMRTALGSGWYDRLTRTLDAAEQEALAWHRSEPRLWNRLVASVIAGFGVRRWPTWMRSRSAGAQEWAITWLGSAVAAWEREGRIDADQAAAVRARLIEPEFQEASRHFGAHMLVSVPLRFPIGSIVRVAMVASAWTTATARYLRRRIDRETWRRARSIHSLPVLLISGLPGIGGFAYLAAKPIRRNRLIVRAALDAVLLKLLRERYERGHLRGRIAPPIKRRIGGSVPDWDRFWEDLLRPTQSAAALVSLAPDQVSDPAAVEPPAEEAQHAA